MACTVTITADVFRHTDGAYLGQVVLREETFERYVEEAGPEGLTGAGSILTTEQMAELGVESGTTVFLTCP